jgi:ABC-2 type transport system ATP-binding protein
MSVIEARALTRTFHVRTPLSRSSGGPSGWRRLRRTRTEVRAVDSIDVTIEPGETIGYIGANGAGKSTTIKMLTGILTPTSGSVRTCGLDPVADRRRLAARIGVVFGQRSQLWWDLPLVDSLRILATLHRMSPAAYARRRDHLVERLDLGGFVDRPVRQLSLGQRMRGELAAALVHSPELLLLDEPTVGLDVLSKERLRAVLRSELAEEGRTLLLTTHDMDDVERLCRRILVVDRGRVAYDGGLPGLVERVGAQRILVVDLAEPAPPLDDVPHATLLDTDGGGLRQRLAFAPEATTAAEVLAAVSARHTVRDLSIEEPDIEDVVRRLYLSTTP